MQVVFVGHRPNINCTIFTINDHIEATSCSKYLLVLWFVQNQVLHYTVHWAANNFGPDADLTFTEDSVGENAMQLW